MAAELPDATVNLELKEDWKGSVTNADRNTAGSLLHFSEMRADVGIATEERKKFSAKSREVGLSHIAGRHVSPPYL